MKEPIYCPDGCLGHTHVGSPNHNIAHISVDPRQAGSPDDTIHSFIQAISMAPLQDRRPVSVIEHHPVYCFKSIHPRTSPPGIIAVDLLRQCQSQAWVKEEGGTNHL